MEHTYTPLILRMVDYVKKMSFYSAEWLDECLICHMVQDLAPEVGTRAMHEKKRRAMEKKKIDRSEKNEKQWDGQGSRLTVNMLSVTNSETSLLGLRTKILPTQCLFRSRTLSRGSKIFRHISYADTINLCLKLKNFGDLCHKFEWM